MASTASNEKELAEPKEDKHLSFEKKAAKADPTVKARDFLSKTRAFLDVVGINSVYMEGGSVQIPYLKRAVLLRSLILRHMGVVDRDKSYALDIDDRVLSAFLDEERYVHDARSMEAIVNFSVLDPGNTFTPSCIVNNCLDLHVGMFFNLRLKGGLFQDGRSRCLKKCDP